MATPRGEWGCASDLDDVSGEVAIVGVGDSDHSEASGRTQKEMAAQAVERALADAGLEPATSTGSCTCPWREEFTDADFHEHFGTSHDMWESQGGRRDALGGDRAVRRGAGAARRARRTYILNTFGVAWATQRIEMVGGPGEIHAQELFKQNLEMPFGLVPPTRLLRHHRSPAHARVRHHRRSSSARSRWPAGVTPTSPRRGHARQAALAGAVPRVSPTIVEPFRKEDCCLISDGGGAYLMTTPERARDLAKPRRRGRRRRASATRCTGAALVPAAGVHLDAAGVRRARPRSRWPASRPTDVDVYTVLRPVHDRHTLMQIEDSGFCEKGEGGAFVERRHR